MIPPARGTLAWRLYAVGVMQLVLLVAAVIGVGWLLRPAPPEPGTQGVGIHARDGRDDAPPEMRDHSGPNGMADHPDPPAHGGPFEAHGPDDPGDRGEPPPPEGHGPPPHGPRPIHHRLGGVPLAPLVTLFVSGLVIVGIGAYVTARWILAPVDHLARTARALGGGDLTARTGLKRKDELGELGRAFDEMAERIQKLMLAEKELMANVSHELRTPLARIRVALDIAGEGDADMSRLSMTEIGTDLAELETLIDDILTATRLAVADKGSAVKRFEMHVEEIGPDAIAARASDRFRLRHPHRPFTATVAEGLPLVKVDPMLFRRVLDNLLENADKYSPDGTRPIALRVEARGDQVVFAVEDEGLGISEEDLPHVFTPFFRGERSRFRGTGGVGLGLTLANRITEAHGGTIAIRSAVSRGSTFTVTIPRLEG